MKIGIRVLFSCLLISANAWAQSGAGESETIMMRNRKADLFKSNEPLKQPDLNSNDAPSMDVNIGGVSASIWAPSQKSLTVTAPLIVFSHSLGGCEKQSEFLTRALSGSGYFVVAPRHADALCSGSFSKPQTPQEKPEGWTSKSHINRRNDIIKIIEGLRTDPDLSNKIDFEKIALIGYEAGGYTALGTAGGWQEWTGPSIKAVVALSPYCHPFLKPQTLKTIAVPVQYQIGEKDILVAPAVLGKDGCYDQTAAPAMYVQYKKVGHYAWTDLDISVHESIIIYTKAFLDRYLLGIQTAPLEIPMSDVKDLKIKQKNP